MPTFTYRDRGGRVHELQRRIADADANLPRGWRRVRVARFGVTRGVPDPGSADVAVPRALRELEHIHGAATIARRTGHSVRKLKRVWNIH